MDKILKNAFFIVTVSLYRFQCAPNYCPKHCVCDSYKNLNRADCSAQKLISPSVNIPKTVEILDLSENAITTLDNNCFEDLFHLLNLTLSYNNIHTIYLDAFSPLAKIQFIDLSNNRLEYFDQRIFENNKKLSSLNLSGNKFMSLQNKPLLKSTSLQYLSLRNSQITHVYPALFKEMPSLLKIDISDNLLITITYTPFSVLQILKFVNLERNRWICDKNIETTIKVMRRKNIDVRMDKCNFKNQRTQQMFERMVVVPAEPISTTERPKTNIEFVWKNWNILNNTDEARCFRNDIEETCRLYVKCMTDYRTLLDKSNSRETMPLDKLSSSTSIVDFCMGFILGALATILPVLCIYFVRKICLQKKRRYMTLKRSPPQKRNQRNTMQALRAELQFTASPLPVIPTFLNRSLSTPEHRTRELNQRNFPDFISGMFERPKRRRYCRAVNQTTVDVIRRVSRRSLLTATRLSQHLGENQNPPQDMEQLIDRDNINSSRESECNSQIQQRSADLESSRSETPPPAYGDVVCTDFI